MSRLFRARRMLAESLGTDSIDRASEPRARAAKPSTSPRAARAPKPASPALVVNAERFSPAANLRADDRGAAGTAQPARAA
jgi:hypothetical protein